MKTGFKNKIFSLIPDDDRFCLIFLDRDWAPPEIEELRRGLPGDNIYFSVSGSENREKVLSSRRESSIMDRKTVDFTDRLKRFTNGEGFKIIIVADSDPDAIRRALGSASIFGEIILLIKPSGPVIADLQNTINYKSLKITACF